MLISFHFPIIDLRGFFSQDLGRISSGIGNGSLRELQFLRSAGRRRWRRLGGGDRILDEPAYFDLNRILATEFDSNRVFPTVFKILKPIERLYYIDDVCLRAEVGFAQRFERDRISLNQIMEYVLSARLSADANIFAPQPRIEDGGPLLSALVQSRTTAERRLKEELAIKAVVSGNPIVFVEGYQDEIRGLNNAQPLPLSPETSHLKLYHFYPSKNLRGWIILRDRRADNGKQVATAARLLRMYLSRIYTYGSSFRSLARSMPKLVSEVAKYELSDELLPSVYAEYMAQSRRFASSLSKDLAILAGHEYGHLARLAHNMLQPDEERQILDAHRRIIELNQIFGNFKKDLKNEVSLSQAFNENAAGAHSTNVIINVLGSLRRVGQFAAPPLAKPQVRIGNLLPRFREFSQFISVLGAGLSEYKFAAIEEHLKSIEELSADANFNGPMMLSKVREIEAICASLQFERRKAFKLLEAIKTEILI